MNQMWADMTDLSREEYRQYFIAYHDSVSRYLLIYVQNFAKVDLVCSVLLY
jgi:hypothetical protein